MTPEDLSQTADAALVLFGSCLAAGGFLGLIVAFVNSWRV